MNKKVKMKSSTVRNCKYLFVLAVLIPMSFLALAQKPDWHNLDLKTDTVFGISTEKAYVELLKGKKSRPVIVAVLDGGVDTAHEDLQPIIWNNPKEKPGNRKDDDKNGHIDDMHGWNFIGSDKGNVHYDNLEVTRLLRANKNKYDSLSLAPDRDSAFLTRYEKMKKEVDQALGNARTTLRNITMFKKIFDTLLVRIGKDNPTKEDLAAYQPRDGMEEHVIKTLGNVMQDGMDVATFRSQELDEGLKHFQSRVEYMYNMDFDPRPIVGDDYNDDGQKNYGNADVTGPDATHGTHVSGIIAAVRDNGIGIQGIADNAVIMAVRVTPDGDERDKDVANGIRYAAENGARVINMSFGKAYAWDKKAVDEAVKYAMSKDVLIVHAAGNDGKNLDSLDNFPNRHYADKSGDAGAWIEVGASGWKDDESLAAPFSNYGKTSVDVFAPGEQIHSSIPGSKYASFDGTSMASPVVAGLAALIREYYPKLKAAQVKEIILNSVVKVDHNVTITVNGAPRQVPFSSLCISGGIVNVYQALKLAATY